MRRIGRWFRRNWREILDSVLCGAIMIGFFLGGFILRGFVDSKDIGIWKSLATEEAPDRCSLCRNGKGLWYHAPCLVNLSTGEIVELVVYDPDPRHVGEIAEEQQTGFAQLFNRAGVSGIRDASNHTCHATVKTENMDVIDACLFCPDCRTLLASVATNGYVLLDIHSLENIVPYEVKEGAEYTIRDYTVAISFNDEWDWYEVDVQGNIE